MPDGNERRRPPEETPLHGQGRADDLCDNVGDGALEINDAEAAQHRVEEARRAFERGWRLLPLNGKVPIQDGWQKAEPASLELVLRWAQQNNVGLRTGAASGVVVIDDDTDGGIAEELLGLPPTQTVVTGAGHKHHYFRAPDTKIKNSAGRLADGIDVRGDGGQVVFVGSIHPETGRMYRWEVGRSPDDIDLAPLPDALLERILNGHARTDQPSKRPRSKSKPTGRLQKYAESALGSAYDTIARTSEGQRNDVLNREGFRMGRFVGAGLLDRAHVEEQLAHAAACAGLPANEVRTTLRSALDAGSAEPFDESELGGAASQKRASAGNGQHDLDDEPVPPQTERPQIFLAGGKLPDAVDEAEEALLAAGGHGIYQRGTQLIRIARTRSTLMRGWGRTSAGALLTLQVEPVFLVELMMRSATWWRFDRRTEELYEIDCPPKVANTYLARAGHWRLPSLLGVVEAPTLRPDGTILSTPGYDAETYLFLDTNGVEFPPIPLEPTLDDAIAAVEVLSRPIAQFPFVAPSDRAAALAAMLTALIRRALRSAPLIAFRAPKMGTGKSLLADVVSMVATGRPASVMSQGKDEDEDRKRMLAILIEGESVACIDNIERPLGGAALCSVLTQETWKDRILGRSAMVSVPTATTWLATGNNLVFSGDITTRVIPCDLDAGLERPEEREFKVNLYEFVPRNRGELVVAGLTLLRAYHVAGRPAQGLSVFGRFEQWSDSVRSALVWVGEADPCEGRGRIEDCDPVRSGLRRLLHTWFDTFRDDELTVSELMAHTKPVLGTNGGELWEALVEVAGGRGAPNARRLGWCLTKHVRRPEGGYVLERVGDRQGVAVWRVRRV